MGFCCIKLILPVSQTWKNCIYLFFSPSDVILNMVNNIAVNVLGGGSEIPGMTCTGSRPLPPVSSYRSQPFFVFEGDSLYLQRLIS